MHSIKPIKIICTHEAQAYENDDGLYEICKWLSEFEVHLQERYEGIISWEQELQEQQVEEGQKAKTWLVFAVIFGIFLVMFTTALGPDRNSTTVVTPIPPLVQPPEFIDPFIEFSSLGYSEEVELYIDQAVRAYLSGEYSKEFSTNGMMINPEHLLGFVTTLIYFPIDYSEMTVHVFIDYQVDGDSVEITRMFHATLNLGESDDE